MPNDYLIHCHQFITHEIEQAQASKRRAEARGDAHQIAYHRGQMEELNSLRSFMAEHFNLTTQQYF